MKELFTEEVRKFIEMYGVPELYELIMQVRIEHGKKETAKRFNREV